MCVCVVYVRSVWDWDASSRLSVFSVRNPRHTRITYSEFINAHDQALLLTGSGLLSRVTCVCVFDGGDNSVDDDACCNDDHRSSCDQ